LAIDGFFTAVGGIAGVAIVFLYAVIWRKSTERIKELEGTEGQEGMIWLGDIWNTDIKEGAEEFYSYVTSGIANLESPDRFLEFFSNQQVMPTLRKKMHALATSYNEYSRCKALFSNSKTGHESIKNWTLKTIFVLFGVASWAGVGFLTESTFLISYTQVFWVSFGLLTILLIACVYNLSKYYKKSDEIDSAISREKSKHSDVLGKVL
jgi:hypothetical protein